MTTAQELTEQERKEIKASAERFVDNMPKEQIEAVHKMAKIFMLVWEAVECGMTDTEIINRFASAPNYSEAKMDLVRSSLNSLHSS